jgi:hypothetical protein
MINFLKTSFYIAFYLINEYLTDYLWRFDEEYLHSDMINIFELTGNLEKHIEENYLLKELYIEEEKLEKLKTFVSEEFFNFKIFPIKVIEQGDIADNFIKNFNGIMGIKYY